MKLEMGPNPAPCLFAAAKLNEEWKFSHAMSSRGDSIDPLPSPGSWVYPPHPVQSWKTQAQSEWVDGPWAATCSCGGVLFFYFQSKVLHRRAVLVHTYVLPYPFMQLSACGTTQKQYHSLNLGHLCKQPLFPVSFANWMNGWPIMWRNSSRKGVASYVDKRSVATSVARIWWDAWLQMGFYCFRLFQWGTCPSAQTHAATGTDVEFSRIKLKKKRQNQKGEDCSKQCNAKVKKKTTSWQFLSLTLKKCLIQIAEDFQKYFGFNWAIALAKTQCVKTIWTGLLRVVLANTYSAFTF